MTLTIRNPVLGKATLLDPAGYAAKPLALTKTAGGVTLKLPPNTMYLVVE